MKTISTLSVLSTLVLTGTGAVLAEPIDAIGKRVLDQYQSIHVALAADSMGGVLEAATTIAKTIERCECMLVDEAASRATVAAARALQGADLAALREQFKALSSAMPAFLEITGVTTAQLYYCPMAKAYWLQPKQDTATRNPYFGPAMHTCGTQEERVTK